MKKLLLFAWLGFLSSPAFASSFGPYSLIAPAAVDGDTINADVQVWPGLIVDTSIRVIGVDTPEVRGAKCPEEKEAAITAKSFTEAWLRAYQPVTINTVRMDKYSGRYDAVVLGRNGENLAAALIKAGHGRSYRGGTRQSWCP